MTILKKCNLISILWPLVTEGKERRCAAGPAGRNSSITVVQTNVKRTERNPTVPLGQIEEKQTLKLFV
jgi:hypothetical protein